jgi:hypothetical protein
MIPLSATLLTKVSMWANLTNSTPERVNKRKNAEAIKMIPVMI